MIVAVGPASNKPVGHEAPTDNPWEGSGLGFELALGPMHFVPPPSERRWDLRIGIFGEGGGGDYARSGALAELVLRPWQVPVPSSIKPSSPGSFRVSTGVGLERVGWSEPQGWGVRSTVAVEVVGFLQGRAPSHTGGDTTVLWGFGEAGLGWYVQMGYRATPPYAWWHFSSGLTLIIPAAVVIAWAVPGGRR